MKQILAAGGKKIKLGLDNFSIPSFGWKTPQLLEHAASLRLDVMFFSDLDVFEDHGDSYLKKIKAKADDLGIQIHVGTGSVCPSSKAFSKNYGAAEEQLREK